MSDKGSHLGQVKNASYNGLLLKFISNIDKNYEFFASILLARKSKWSRKRED